ncbi:MAG: ABC transporter permease, partial [Methylothermaceae bacterium]|nr:ABC transporter permease [Methylothermaceae bacterium]
MSNTSIAAKPLPDNPRIQREDRKVMLFGAWNLRGLAVELPRLRRRLKRYARQTGLEWDLSEVSALDSAGAFVLWQVWGERFPAHLRMSDEYVTVFDRWRKRQIPSVQDAPRQNHTRGENLKQRLQTFTGQITGLLILLGRLVFDVGYLISHPPDIPWREISATLYDVGVRALGITAMVGFLIGIVLSYLSALQLENYGAQAFAVNILG